MKAVGEAAPGADELALPALISVGRELGECLTRHGPADRLAAFKRTETEVATRLRPFVEVALPAAGRSRRPALD